MSTQKPSKPDVILPDNFGGIKTPYSEAQIRDGYLQGVPEIVDGGNINYEKDALFRKVKYCEAIADVINGILPNNTIAVDSNNRFTYTTQVQMATDAEFQAGTSELKVPNVKQTKTECERIMSAVDTKVNKSGDTITGILNVGGRILVTSEDGGIELLPSNSDAVGGIIDFHFAGSSEDFTSRLIENQAGLTYESGIDQRKTGEILTTVSRGSNYVRFGNGLQICWGSGTGVQTFQQPFRDIWYMIADSDLTYHKYEGMWTTNKTTTQFEVKNSGNAQWIAIGYWY